MRAIPESREDASAACTRRSDTGPTPSKRSVATLLSAVSLPVLFGGVEMKYSILAGLN